MRETLARKFYQLRARLTPRWVSDARTFFKWRKGSTFVLFVYPYSQLTQAQIKDGRIELGEGGLMYGFNTMLGDSLNEYVVMIPGLTEEET